MTIEDIKHRFTSHPPTRRGIGEALDDVTDHMIALGSFLDDLLPDGREKALALTKLEECSMWAKAAIARHQE